MVCPAPANINNLNINIKTIASQVEKKKEKAPRPPSTNLQRVLTSQVPHNDQPETKQTKASYRTTVATSIALYLALTTKLVSG